MNLKQNKIIRVEKHNYIVPRHKDVMLLGKFYKAVQKEPVAKHLPQPVKAV